MGRASRRVVILVAADVLAASLGGVPATGGAAAAPATGQAPAVTPNPGLLDNVLTGVSAVSGSDAWAVGYYHTATGAYKTLILHWNGRAWSKVKSPNPSQGGVGLDELFGVSAVSGSDAWAVGEYTGFPANAYDTLILHWNGTAWTQVKSPNPSSCPGTECGINVLDGVSALSGRSAWAVGEYQNSDGVTLNSLALRWNGTAWTQVKSPNPSCPDAPGWDNLLNGVSALSGSDAWAAGDYLDCSGAVAGNATLVAHWNGTAWANASVIRTSTSVSSSANPVTTGKAVTYTARVAPAPVSNLGWVAFYDNGSLISSCRHRALRSGKATCTVTYASAGSHAIKAAYPGYADYGRSTSPRLTETVRR